MPGFKGDKCQICPSGKVLELEADGYSDETCQIVVDIQDNVIGINITETFASRRASKSLLDVVVDKAKDAFDDLQDLLDGEDDKEEEQEVQEEVKEE